jgi:hypothetical protein
MSSYLGRLSLCCLPNRTESSTSRENGLDGIRTRICDLDRVLCSRYTTSPVLSLRNDEGYSKIVDHNFSRRVSNRDKCIVDLGKEAQNSARSSKARGRTTTVDIYFAEERREARRLRPSRFIPATL